MPEFLPVALSDISWIRPIIFDENTKNADFSFMNIFAWGEVYDVKACKLDDCLVVKMITDGQVGYSFPIGSKNEEIIGAVVQKLIDLAADRGEALILESIAPEKIPFLEKYYPGRFDISPKTDLFDYVYYAEKLSSLSGKKLHAKRNYINRFIAENDWCFEPIDENNISECMSMVDWWSQGKPDEQDTIEGEHIAMKKALENFGPLELDGGILRVSGKMCAFSVGERLSNDTYVVHFEKAFHEMTGAYQMINREFVRHILQKYPEIVYINREDDMGLENLRKAKHSYYPDYIVEKYMAVLR